MTRARAAALGMRRRRIADDIERRDAWPPAPRGRSGAVAFQSRYVRAGSFAGSDAVLAAIDGSAEGCRLARTACLPAGMPSITSCSVTLARNDAICSPSASHRPCVRQRWPRHAGLGRLAAAARHADVLFDRRHDLGDADRVGRPAQPVAARPSARALDQPRTAQLEEQLLQVGQRDLLALGDRRQRHRTARRRAWRDRPWP